MRLPRTRGNHGLAENEAMTPMIDVVFLLLVFFVCASVGQTPDAFLPAQLSGTMETDVEIRSSVDDEWERPLILVRLSVGPNGSTLITLNESPVSGFDDLRQRLQQLADVAPDSRVVLDVADTVNVQKFVAAYDLCRSLHLKHIAFAVPRAN